MDGPLERSNSRIPKNGDAAAHLDEPANQASCGHDHSIQASCGHDHAKQATSAHDHSGHEQNCASVAVNNDSGSVPQTGITPERNHVPETAFSRVVGMMDIAGVFASTICTVHCLLLPLVVLLLPVLAKPLLQHDYVHMALAGFVFTFCLMAFIPGYLKHRDARLLWFGGMGVALVFFATFVARQWGEVVEASVITAGNTVIIFCHLLNRKLLAHLKCQHHH
jgi:hypothetical protein